MTPADAPFWRVYPFVLVACGMVAIVAALLGSIRAAETRSSGAQSVVLGIVGWSLLIAAVAAALLVK